MTSILLYIFKYTLKSSINIWLPQGNRITDDFFPLFCYSVSFSSFFLFFFFLPWACITFVIRKKNKDKVLKYLWVTMFSHWKQMKKKDDSNVIPTLLHLPTGSILSNILQDTPLDMLFIRQPGTMKEKREEISLSVASSWCTTGRHDLYFYSNQHT